MHNRHQVMSRVGGLVNGEGVGRERECSLRLATHRKGNQDIQTHLHFERLCTHLPDFRQVLLLL